MSARPHQPALDGLRAVAILSVIVVHSAPFSMATRQGRLLAVVQSFGWAGVDLFFVLSGFLITGILLDSSARPDYYRRFYLRRTFRIMPLYVVFCLGVFVLAPLWLGAGSSDARAVTHASPWYLTYMLNLRIALDNNWAAGVLGTGAVWSLCVEEQFYLVWPSVVRRMTADALTRICLGLALIALLVRVLAVVADRQFAGYVLLPARMDGLALGAWIATQAHAGRSDRLAQLAPWGLGLSGAGLAAIIGATGYAGWDAPWMLTLGCTCTVVASASLLVFALRPTRIQHVASHPVLGYVGRRAYALYLLNALAIWLAQRTDSRLAVVVVLFALAELSWRVIEAPAQRLGHRLARSLLRGPQLEPSRGLLS